MNRLLVMLALSTLAGCSCWDDKYQQYCDASQKCALEGPVTRLRFNMPQRDINARDCLPVQVALGLPDGGFLQPFPPTTFTVVGDPPDAVHTWDNDKCQGVPVSQFTSSGPTREFWFQTEMFGEVELRAQTLGTGADGDSYKINSRASFRWDPAGYFVPVGDCSTGTTATLVARSVTGDLAVPAARETLVLATVSTGFSGTDTNGGCVQFPRLGFKAGDSSTGVRLGSSGVAAGLLTADAGFFENSFAIARLDSACAPLSTPCTLAGPGCCAVGANSCDAGMMFCAAPSSASCVNPNDCETGTCDSLTLKCQ